MYRGKTATAAVLLAAGLGLSACGSDSGSGAEQQNATPVQTETSSSSMSTSTSESEETSATGQASNADFTPPGTELKVGDTATVPFEYIDNKGTIELTVDAIKKGSSDDLAKYGKQAKGMTPYYIKYTIKNVGGTDLENARPNFDGLLKDGSSTGVVISGDVAGKCESEGAPESFKEKGATFDSCDLAATTGAKVTAVEWDQFGDYEDEPIVWTK